MCIYMCTMSPGPTPLPTKWDWGGKRAYILKLVKPGPDAPCRPVAAFEVIAAEGDGACPSCCFSMALQGPVSPQRLSMWIALRVR